MHPVLVPADCTDGFLGAYWRRPEAYLRPAIRAAISSLSLIDQDVVRTAMSPLAADLASGRWQARHSGLLTRGELDLGYRLVVARPRSAQPRSPAAPRGRLKGHRLEGTRLNEPPPFVPRSSVQALPRPLGSLRIEVVNVAPAAQQRGERRDQRRAPAATAKTTTRP